MPMIFRDDESSVSGCARSLKCNKDKTECVAIYNCNPVKKEFTYVDGIVISVLVLILLVVAFSDHSKGLWGK